MLQQFLDAKPLYYTEIDYTRMPRAYKSLKSKLKLPKIVHLVGTNGKGTTGRFLASALCKQGKKVVHYTSPHILKFNERIWIEGENISDAMLEELHQMLQTLLDQEFLETLSYFEYTTFLAVLAAQNAEYLIFEAGLGGEFDATAVFENVLTLVTPIDKDHEAFLGDTIEKIATTKLNAVQKKGILAQQKHSEVYDVAKKLLRLKGIEIFKAEQLLNEEDLHKIDAIAKQNNLAPYLKTNLMLSIAAFKELGFEYEPQHFLGTKLFGRLSQIAPNILLDVGHNALAAESIYESLKGQKYTLVYNSYKDKDYIRILEILKPLIDELLIIKVDDERIEKKEHLVDVLESLEIPYGDFEKLQTDKNYLIFGSFSVAEAFLKVYHG